MRAILSLVVALLLTSACREPSQSETADPLLARTPVVPGLLGPGDGVAYDTLVAEVAAARGALAEGRVPHFACETAELAATELVDLTDPRVASLRAELARLCRREVPLVVLSRALDAAEERLRTERHALVDGDCAEAARAAAPLAEHHAEEPAVAAQLSRWREICRP